MPEELRKKVPKDLQFWKEKDREKALEKRENLYNEFKKVEVEKQELLDKTKERLKALGWNQQELDEVKNVVNED